VGVKSEQARLVGISKRIRVVRKNEVDMPKFSNLLSFLKDFAGEFFVPGQVMGDW
jgi:hypothetical protein